MAAHLVKVLIGPYTFPSPYNDAARATGAVVSIDATTFAAIPGGDFTGTPKLQDLGINSTTSGGGTGTVVDATASVKGIIRLTGDLSGTAATPTVPGLAGKADTGHTHSGITPPPEDGADAVPSLRTLGVGPGQALAGATFSNHLTTGNPHPQYAADDALTAHETSTSAHGSANIPLSDAIPGQSVTTVHGGLVDIYSKLPGGSSAYEQDEPYNFPGTLTVQSGVAKFLARVATDILGVEAIVGTASTDSDILFTVKAGASSPEGTNLFPASVTGPTVRDSKGNVQPAGSSISCTKPTTVAGDMVLLFLQGRANDAGTPTPPTGFSLMWPLTPGANATSTRPKVWIYSKPLLLSEGAGSYTFTGLDAVSPGRYALVAVSIATPDPYTPIGPGLANLSGITDVNATAASSITVGSFSQTFNKSLNVLVVAANNGTAGDINLTAAPSGWTRIQFQGAGSGGSVALAVYVKTAVDTPAATPSIAATKVSDGTPASVFWLGWQFAIRPNRPCIPIQMDRSQGEYIPSLAIPHMQPRNGLAVGIERCGTGAANAVAWVRRAPH